ncbi:unnamed protein product [Mytilus coruscus]|uniref:Uncharacterized protein n=1 Tax=Mytilus coruscus TaxID=42192 RepID=A0A6J8C9G8_MYTCO|nr:unnamed protein product [Mytilus coruscus]
MNASQVIKGNIIQGEVTAVQEIGTSCSHMEIKMATYPDHEEHEETTFESFFKDLDDTLSYCENIPDNPPNCDIKFFRDRLKSAVDGCAEENTDNFMSEWQKANQEMSHLLNRNTEIVVRATKLPQCDIPSMNFQPDIDGIVVELTSFAGITFPLTHISILRNDFNSLERIYPKLKKHLDLRHYSEQTLSVLAQCKGTEISIEDTYVKCDQSDLRLHQISFGTTLKSKAAAAALAGRARNTLMKVDLNSVKHWTVMPDECMDVLNLLQVAVDEVTLPDGLTPIIFAFRFGERTKHDISLTGFNMIRKTTVHVGVTISSNDLQILWARHGIQQVTGDRGTLYSCYTFSDIVNFQSNTDGRNIDVSADVLNFYGDIPHRRPRLNVYHPVTGIIVCGDVVNKTTREAIERGVGPYIFSFDQNVNLLQDLRCRMEFVVAVPPVPHVITPDMYVSLPNIERLLQKIRFIGTICKC